MHIKISQWQFDNLGFDFSDEKVIELNQFMEALFEDHMYFWVEQRISQGLYRKKLIELFALQHNIKLRLDDDDKTEGDISLEALVKTEGRRRKLIQDQEREQGRTPTPFLIRSKGKRVRTAS